jgi:long-chain fatty acid transport protein
VKMRILAAVITALMATSASAAGFRLTEAGARASGMGGAVSALIDDSTALYFNPAGILGRTGLDASVGISLILPSVTFSNDATGVSTSTLPGVATPFNLFLSYGLTENLAVGIGIFNPYGASATWPSGWEGAGRALTSSVQTFDINPTIAYALHPRLKLALGFQAVRGTVFIERGLNFVDSAGKVSLGGDAWGFGWNAGMQLEVIEKVLFFGGSYRSAVGMNFAGRAHFSNVPGDFQSLLADQKITSSISLPDTASFGVGIKPIEALRIGLEVNATVWQSFTDLTIAFENPALTNPLPKRWQSVASFNAGVEYAFTQAIAGRLGFVWDPTASPGETLTPDLPDATRYRITAGAGWRSSFGLGVDLAYQYVILAPAHSSAPGFAGTYSGSAHVVSLNVGYRM